MGRSPEKESWYMKIAPSMMVNGKMAEEKARVT